jgi:hypothetical protein
MSAEDRDDPPRVRAVVGLTAKFTPEEAAQIEEVAARTGHTTADWLRRVALFVLRMQERLKEDAP